MKTTFRSVPAVAVLALLAACGGSGNAALSKTFNYGSPQAPSSQEQSAAASAQSGMADSAAFNATADAAKGLAIVGLTGALATAALGDLGIAAAQPAHLSQALSVADLSTCATVSGNTVTFKNCSATEQGFSFSLNGSITATSGAVSWNISGSFSGTEVGVSFDITSHAAGNFTFTANAVNGNATSELNGSFSGGGQSTSIGVALAVVVDHLTTQAATQSTPFCLTSGGLEIKRVWTQKPQGVSGPGTNDAGVKIVWSACNTFLVARSQ